MKCTSSSHSTRPRKTLTPKEELAEPTAKKRKETKREVTRESDAPNNDYQMWFSFKVG